MKRILSVILIFALLCGCALSEGMTREEAYLSGIDALYSESVEDCEVAANFFDRAGAYSQAKYYAIYARALAVILDFSSTPKALEQAITSLDKLSGNTKFVNDLLENGFPSCEELLKYIEARKAESAGLINEAIAIYQDLFILDALERSIDLENNSQELLYQNAMELYNEGKFIEAAKAFEALGGYLDSKQMSEKAFDQHPHDWQDATCTEPMICRICGKIEGNANGHEWVAATCTNPKTCKVCGETEDKALGHSWREATCETPKTCARCGKTEGAKLGHNWTAATCDSPKTCTRCKKTEGKALGHDYAPATYDAPETCRRCGVTRGEKLRRDYQVGDYVTFGTYPQTASGTDNTPIEWLVLDQNGDEYLLISRYALDCKPYNTTNTAVSWEGCSLRTWLNNDFYNMAFSAADMQSIVYSKVTADKNPAFNTNTGNNTTDNVFLLSIAEAHYYFGDNLACMCAPTDYAVRNHAYTNNFYITDNRACGWWWLRSPGCISNRAAYVNNDGSVFVDGDYVYYSYISVRPCIRVWLP